MSTTTTDPQTPGAQAATEPQAGAEDQVVTPGEGTPQEPAAPVHPWEDPATAEAEIKRLRTEADAYRTQRNEFETQLKAAKSQEDIDAAVAEWQTKSSNLERENLVLRLARDLPEGLHKYVLGSTEDEIKASVEELKGSVAPAALPAPRRPDAVGGGLDPKSKAEPNDPAKLAQAVRDARRRAY